MDGRNRPALVWHPSPLPGRQAHHPPKNGDLWAMDFSRFNTAKAPAPAKDSGGWALNHHGIWDSHVPECFARVVFEGSSDKK